jgi:murein DD-endopeptidase MepM/ murein hydrolase activator NlpD
VFRLYEEHFDAISAPGASELLHQLTLPFILGELALEEPERELPVPVYGVKVSQIADTWGTARFEGRTHEGVDIFAPTGTPVFSATRGYVTRTNFGSLGGLNVIVTGPGGVRYYYAHLDRIADGIKLGTFVTEDSVLGFVGATGNASGTPPHLHFGVYEGRREPINPYPLLVDRWI